MRWIRDNWLGAIGLLIALLTYLGIQPSDIAGGLSGFVMPLLYIFAGTLIGWSLCRLRYRIYRHGNEQQGIPYDEYAEQFATIPYEFKTFLKAALVNGAVYTRTSDAFHNKNELDFFAQFTQRRTLCNDITKHTLKQDVAELFKTHPDLLQEVRDVDIAQHVREGEEGSRPVAFSDHLYWWCHRNNSKHS